MESYHPFRSPQAKEAYHSYATQEAQKCSTPSQTLEVETSYGQTFVRISGAKELPALVLLAGSSSSSLMWCSAISEFSKSYRTYAVDNIFDVGLSVNRKDLKTLDALLEWLDELFEALGLSRDINLMAMSYGGWLASQYALRFPHKLNRVVLIAPAATFLPLEWNFLSRALLMALPIRHFTQRYIYWLLNDMMRQGQKDRVDTYIDELWFYRQSFGYKALVPPTLLSDAQLKAWSIPTLLIVGENEKMYSAQEAIEKVQKHSKSIETLLIENTGHDLYFLEEEYIIKKAMEFLE